jgi:hypothetical protein
VCVPSSADVSARAVTTLSSEMVNKLVSLVVNVPAHDPLIIRSILQGPGETGDASDFHVPSVVFRPPPPQQRSRLENCQSEAVPTARR